MSKFGSSNDQSKIRSKSAIKTEVKKKQPLYSSNNLNKENNSDGSDNRNDSQEKKPKTAIGGRKNEMNQQIQQVEKDKGN